MSAYRPTAVDTLDPGQGRLSDFNGREFYQVGQGGRNFHSPDRLGADTLRVVQGRTAPLVTPRRVHATRVFVRLAPVCSTAWHRASSVNSVPPTPGR